MPATFLVLLFGASTPGCCEDPAESERRRLRNLQQELRQQKEIMLPMLYQSQADLAGALNGRDPATLNNAERANLYPLGARYEGNKRAVEYVDSQLENVQYGLNHLDQPSTTGATTP